MPGEDDDPRVRQQVTQRRQHLDSVDTVDGQVEDDGVGPLTGGDAKVANEVLAKMRKELAKT